MPVFGDKEEINPHGREVEEILLHFEPCATTHQLLEVVTEQLEKTLPVNLHGKARQRVLSFLVQIEYRHSLNGHVILASSLRADGRWHDHNQMDNSPRIDSLIEKYREYTDVDGENSCVPAIDMAVGPGGLTRLHVAAMDGEFDEVVRLVECLHASLFVVDNLKKTPCDRARAFGHHTIAEYLKVRMHLRV